MTADEARTLLAALDAASEELEAWTDLRDVPDQVLDALDAARALALKYARADSAGRDCGALTYGDALASRRASDPETEDPCQA
jgi:hypothetical protein